MRLPIVLLLAVLLALGPSAALACGLPLDARIASEQALLVLDGPRQQLIASVDLRDAAPDAAVIFPVPAAPEAVDQPAGGGELFAYLREATRPTIRTEPRLRWGREPEAAGGAPRGVDLLGQETIGGYEVARLAADDAGALAAWLAANGFTAPPAAEPILAAYIADGWSFVAVKLAGDAPDGSLEPLRISYTSERRVYPMRLGALANAPVSVDLFVLDAGRAEAPPMRTAFAGPVAALDPPPPPQLAQLLAGGAYLTHLRASALDPAGLSADFPVLRAASDEPFRDEVVVIDDVYLVSEYPALVAAMLCLFSITPLSLGLAIGIRRRMETIAPDLEKEERRARRRSGRRQE
jgi:hypothetical protein